MYEDIAIDKSEVLRYMGHRGQTVDEKLDTQIEMCISETTKLINPRCVYRYFDIERVHNEIKIKDTNVTLSGKDIYKHLDGCDRIVLMAVTLGIDIERKIRAYTVSDITRGIIMDACATTAVEEVCDRLQDKILTEVSRDNLYITNRYSPGYGDLFIAYQYDFVRLLDTARAIGLSVTDSNLLVPRKSVTAIIGISKYKRNTTKSCESCSNREGCEFRKNDLRCT